MGLGEIGDGAWGGSASWVGELVWQNRSVMRELANELRDEGAGR